MAVDVCAEVSGAGGAAVISPRISFSHDLAQNDAVSVVVPIDRRHDDAAALALDSSSSSDFDFCVTRNFSPQEFSTADELFSHGKILPIELGKNLAIAKQSHPSQPDPPPPPPLPEQVLAEDSNSNSNSNSKKKKLKELISASFEEDEIEKPSSSSSSSSLKSFWQFGRSASLNFDRNRGRGLIRSLQFLSRSNSTGSAPNPKQTPHANPKDQNHSQNRHLRKQSSSSSSSSCSKSYHQKPPLKKNCRSYGDGVRISPVLNLPPQYISKATQGLFGLGSMLCNGKDRKKKKKK